MKKNTLVNLIFLSLVLLSACQEKTTNRPNILFLIADDWSYPHAGIYGDSVVRTPIFDQVAAEGALFHHAYCASPSCSPSRASILTGRYPHQNKSAGNLWSVFPDHLPNWMTTLAGNGYYTGKTRKGWAPGNFEMGGYSHNPAGADFEDFESFINSKPSDQPFAFWFGSSDPHRDYETNTGIQSGLAISEVVVPGFLPDVPCVRNDILDYYYEVERFDRECGEIIQKLREAGQLDNTIVVMTSDNGMPFPRAKANLYDYGTRMPLAIRWPEKIKSGTVINDFMNFIDFGPTFLEAARLEANTEMSGSSLVSLLVDNTESEARDKVFIERERHANVRKGDLSYPMRGVRTHEYLYIRNFMPDRWPAGDSTIHQSVGQFGDIDNSISKFLIMNNRGNYGEDETDLYQLAFEKRPEEELYLVQQDPYQLNNIAGDSRYAQVLEDMRRSLQSWMENTNDPRATDPQTIYWDTVLYTPEYQHGNFDLGEELNKYKIQKTTTDGLVELIECL